MSVQPCGVLVESTESYILYAIQDAIDHSKETGGGWVTVIFNGVPITVHAGTSRESQYKILAKYDNLVRAGQHDWVRDQNDPAQISA